MRGRAVCTGKEMAAEGRTRSFQSQTAHCCTVRACGTYRIFIMGRIVRARCHVSREGGLGRGRWRQRRLWRTLDGVVRSSRMAGPIVFAWREAPSRASPRGGRGRVGPPCAVVRSHVSTAYRRQRPYMGHPGARRPRAREERRTRALVRFQGVRAMRYAGCMADSVRPARRLSRSAALGIRSFSLLWRRGRRDLGLRTYLGLGPRTQTARRPAAAALVLVRWDSKVRKGKAYLSAPGVAGLGGVSRETGC